MSYFPQSARKSPIQPNLTAPSPFRYNPVKLINKPVHAQAPFGSTAKLDRQISNSNRKNQLNENVLYAQQYQQHQSLIDQLSGLVGREEKSSSNFVSKTERFESNKRNSPGPGQYDLISQSNTLYQRKRSNSSQKYKQMMKNNIAVSSPQIKVPSIPSDHLGYREDRNNVMRKVVATNNLQPHPGSYDIRTDLAQSRGLKWKKQLKTSKFTLLTPGPGAYDVKKKLQLKAPVSSFVSASKRFDQSKQKNTLKPGPGSYNPLPLTKKTHSSNQQSNFNSKLSRFSFINQNQKVGPGHYFNSIKERVKAKSVGTLKTKLHIQDSTQKIVQKKTIFDEKNTNPGPGQYSSTQGITLKLQKQLYRKFNETTLPKQKRGIFQVSQSAMTPGPGSYNQKFQKQTEKDKLHSNKKMPRRSQVINLKDYQQQLTPSPFDYGNFSNTIESKVKNYQNKMTLTQSKPFGLGQQRFKHYDGKKSKDLSKLINEQSALFQEGIQPKQLGYYENNKRTKKLVMTNLKVKVPFGSSRMKMESEIASQSPGKFYTKEQPWVKKSHNIRSKLN